MRRFVRWGSCFAVLLVAGGVWLVLDHRSDEAAGRAAVEQYRQRTGVTDVSVAWTERFGDCAVVALHDSRQQGVGSIVVQRAGQTWSTARSTEEEGVFFDSDDVGSHRDCLDVAESSGPLVNGAPVSSR
ncbi:hypothetical protein LWF15_17475 [Kineosporia rhizophila]|uniref:hypothetical protein n=1 Tax=Kineosporia rhizophila TaxID=84633 RepID=UPI001E53A06B|nr:hypothetical protein [Kineosporia rhizophila]MCE0537295.1 hypothetical protein [Kineosporia rhizophila]